MMMPRRRRNTAAQLILLCLLQHTACEAYTPSSSRRQFFIETASAIAVVSTVPPPAQAETSVYNRVQLGHARVRYLLDHWDDVTAVCGTTIMSDTERKQIVRTENGNFCTKTPLKVQDYMGYKSTTDPLYRIDKLLIQDSVTNKLDSDDFVEYLEAVEAFKETADQTAMLAYTSSWGEANPYVCTLFSLLDCSQYSA